MSNYKDLYDYFLSRINIEVWPTENSDMITIEAAAFFAWLDTRGYVCDHLPQRRCIALDYTGENDQVWETYAEWWADPRVIHGPHLFPLTVDLKGELLCEYLNDPANERFTDCRTVDQLPTEFLTSAEKAGKN